MLRFRADDVFVDFCIICGSTMIFRLVSWYFLSRIYEPHLPDTKKERQGLRELFKNMGSSNLGRFTFNKWWGHA